MKTMLVALAMLTCGAGVPASANPGPDNTFKVDPAKSQLIWNARKVTGSHDGFVNIKTGKLEFRDGQLTGGYFEIDMTSITVTDLSGKQKESLEGHLKSDDFFGVEQHPNALLRITSVASRGTAGEYKITANATIKGVTKEIRFNAVVNPEADTAEAELELDRTDYNVRYGSGSFFDNLGDKTIYDEFTIKVRLQLAAS